MSLGPVIFTASFWGPQYRELFLRLSLASLLAPGNIPALTERRASRFLVCTTAADWRAIQADPLFEEARRWIELEFVELRRPVPASLRTVYAEKLRRRGDRVPGSEAEWQAFGVTPHDVLAEGAYAELEQLGQEIGVELNVHHHYSLRIHFMTLGHKAGSRRAFETQGSVFFVGADHVMADGGIPELERIVLGGRRVVITAILRFQQEACLEAIRRADRTSPSGALVFAPRELVAAVFPHPHMETACFEFDSPYFCDTATSASWRVSGDRGILIQNLNFFPLLANFRGVQRHHDEYFDVGGTIDGRYVSLHFDPERDIEMVEDSDRLFVASLTPAADYLYPVSTGRLKTLPVLGEMYKTHLIRRTLRSNVGDPMKRRFYAMPIRLHSEPLGPEWSAIERRSRRIANAALTRVAIVDVLFDLLTSVRRRVRGRRVPWPAGEIYDRWLSHQSRVGGVRVVPLAPVLEAGKWYWEVFSRNLGPGGVEVAGTAMTGVIDTLHSLRRAIGAAMLGTGWGWRADGARLHGGAETAFGECCDSSDETIQVALDLDGGLIWFGRNGAWFDGGDPLAGARPAFGALKRGVQPVVASRHGRAGTATLVARVSARAWRYPAPAGFRPLVESAAPSFAPIGGAPATRTG